MSPKKQILRELARDHHSDGEPTFTRPAEIEGFSRDPENFQKAVNELLRDRLIEGKKDPEGRMAIALNGHRMDDIRKRMRPLWAHPGVLAAVVVAVALWASFAFGVLGATS